jgi:hypothetical protein
MEAMRYGVVDLNMELHAAPIAKLLGVEDACKTIASRQIPYATEQGIFLKEQGISTQE